MKAVVKCVPIFIFICLSCGAEKEKIFTKEELIEQRVEEKMARWQESVTRNCTEDVMEAAEAIVDSVLIAEARISADSIPKPDRPVKPEKPEVKTPNDSMPIAPIFDTLPGGRKVKEQFRDTTLSN